MKYETLDQAVQALKEYQRTMSAYNHAMNALYLDATTAAPAGSAEGRGKTRAALSKAP